MVKVLGSVVRGPLEPHVVEFSETLLRQGYSPSSAAEHVCFIAHLDRSMSVEGIGLDGLTSDRQASGRDRNIRSDVSVDSARPRCSRSTDI